MRQMLFASFCILLFVLCCTAINAQTDTLTILHLNDTHSNLAPLGPRTEDLKGTQGGIARAATVVGMSKMTEPNVLFLHAGDAFIGDLFFNVYFGAAEFQLLASLGLDAMAVGNHEFDLQPSTLEQALLSSFEPDQGFPLLSSNCILDDPGVESLNNYIHPYTVKEVGGVKVGIFGLTTPETNLLSLPAPAVIDTNIIETAAAMVGTLAGENCDVIICLSHLGYALDQLVAEYVPGIDVIVSGHDHYLFEEPVEVESSAGGTTYIVQAGAFYSHIGKMKLEVKDGQVSLLDYEAVALDSSIPEEPAVSAQIDGLIQGIEDIYGPVYTQQIGVAAGYFEEVADPLNYGFVDTPVGNLVADAFRERTGTDIAIEPGGSTAQPIYEGPLVAADIFRTLGYGFNTVDGLGFRIVTFDILGAELLAGLEFGLAGIELNDEFLLQVSGMSYDFLTFQPPFERLSAVLINGEPINPLAVYSVTTNEFVLEVVQLLLGLVPANVVLFEDLTEFKVVSEYIAGQGIIPSAGDRITDTKDNYEGLIVPEAFVLEQNYPNPFNPSTTISFSITKNAFTELKIFNTLGEEITTLVSDNLSPGAYRYEWNAKNLASGIYLYSLRSGEFVQTRKLMLMK